MESYSVIFCVTYLSLRLLSPVDKLLLKKKSLKRTCVAASKLMFIKSGYCL